MIPESNGPLEPLLPPEFYRKAKLKIGVLYAGQMQIDVRIGPETRSARLAALASKPEGIDLDLAYRAVYCVNFDAALAQWKKKPKGKEPVKPELSDEQITAGMRMWDTWYEWSALHRVVQFGTIPQPQIVEAAKLLLREDAQIIAQEAEEIDLAVMNFPPEDQAGAGGSGGGDAGGGKPAGRNRRDL